MTKNWVVSLRFFLVSVTFLLLFSLFFYDLVIFFIQVSRTNAFWGVFSTFYCIWKKVWDFSIFFWIFSFFLSFFLNFYWILTKILIVFLRLFLVCITFFWFFSPWFYDLVIFFIQDCRTIMVLALFSTFY